jgi:ribonuclease HIII
MFWTGSDESGKGDYFGPLVVVAFCCCENDVDTLKSIGIKDSKLLTDKKIIEIAAKIISCYSNNFHKCIFMPEQYNILYAKFKKNNKKLNEMLAWIHSVAISELMQKMSFSKIIIDKFGDEKLISSYINKKLHPNSNIEIEIITKAESDIAVATASVLARYYYINAMDFLSNEYDIKLLKGASNVVKELVRTIDMADRHKLVKMHFKC